MTDKPVTRGEGLAILRDLFGDNRAEWPPERFRELFVEPSYFRKLESRRPSLLVGGRGTGKTTALRSLRFNATLERLEASGRTFGDQEHLGIFVRIDKNRVHAFKGEALSTDTWRKAFAHYFNLLACGELCELSAWLAPKAGQALSAASIEAIAADLALSGVTTLVGLQSGLRRSVSELQLFVNNPNSKDSPPTFSMAEVPVRTMSLAMRDAGMTEDRTIFCCIDEYENLLDDQQAVLNTYIKHAEPPLSYKIGVRKNGLRNSQTISGADPLRTPDDFEEIDIAREGFEYFAEKVASLRLTRARAKGVPVPASLAEFLQELTISEEAMELGAGDVANRVLDALKSEPELHAAFSAKPPSEVYFLQYWAESEKVPLDSLARDWVADEQRWKTRINNYAYASLFWLSRGRKGARTRKYYCGARTLLALPAGNIRYFLELLDRSIDEQTTGEETEESPDGEFTLSPIAQTNAAKSVGLRRLEQIEGLAERGVELKRLVLAIGKVFFELARSPLGRTPEVTSFVVSGEGEARTKVLSLLSEGAANLAFEVTPRTKAPDEMKDDEYRLHPIFCAFFEISHRRKRRATFKASDLMLVFEKPSTAITHLLAGGRQSEDAELPEQLAFFSSFFSGGAN